MSTSSDVATAPIGAYWLRIVGVMLAAALATAALTWIGPLARPVSAAAFGPSGEDVAGGAQISITFNRPLDRRSVEERFRLEPPVPGRFFWDDRTLRFEPSTLLAPDTEYTVGIGEGVRDERGRILSGQIDWRFRTRGPALLLLRGDGRANQLWRVNADGSDAQPFGDLPAGISEIAVAPNGNSLVYTEQIDAQRSRLMLYDPAANSTRPLVDDPQSSAAAPNWSPDGNFLAYEARTILDGSAGAPRIWLAQPDGTLLGPLLSDSQRIAFAPRWSADGNRVVFIDGLSRQFVVYNFFSDLAEELPLSGDEAAIWLPDRPALVARNADPQNARIVLITPSDPSNIQALSPDGVTALSPAPAPDGSAVAYTQREPDGSAAIWLAGLDGSAPRRLSSAGDHQDVQPIWSPDGTYLAFIRISAAQPQGMAMLIDLRSGAERPLLEGVQQVAWLP